MFYEYDSVAAKHVLRIDPLSLIRSGSQDVNQYVDDLKSVKITNSGDKVKSLEITNEDYGLYFDDFNNDNGATWFLPNSHTLKSKPDNSFFYKNAKKLTAKAGSILYWNPKIWHSGGDNITDSWRDAFTIVMTRPFCKQRMDIPTMLGEINLKDKAKRRLGYFNIPPKSYKDYYERK